MTAAPRLPSGSLEEARQLRLLKQREFDQARSKAERNRLGQFATPDGLADDVAALAMSHFPYHQQLDVLEPAVGLGSLWDALLRTAQARVQGVAFEIDPQVASVTRALWEDSGLAVTTGNFTAQLPPAHEAQVDLLISNPPYVRHHHLDPLEKKQLRKLAEARSGIKPNGYMGLYGYFMLLAHAWIKPDGIAVWLIPSEFMDVGYGTALKTYLLNQVTLLSVHTFTHTTAQFDDAVVSSAVVTYRMAAPPADHHIEFTSGDHLLQPIYQQQVNRASLKAEQKWSALSHPATPKRQEGEVRLGEMFDVRRGAATGDNSFFILDARRARDLGLPAEFLRPVLPSPRHLKTEHIDSRDDGQPDVDQTLMLIACDLPELQVQEQYPALWAYFRQGVESGVSARYLCEHRTPWYRQENRPPAPFLCTYMGRGRNGGNPFRFILNRSQATATNVYLMLYPKGEMAELLSSSPSVHKAVWTALNDLGGEAVKREGRVYGGGLHKVEPGELVNTPAGHVLEAARAARLQATQSQQFQE